MKIQAAQIVFLANSSLSGCITVCVRAYTGGNIIKSKEKNIRVLLLTIRLKKTDVRPKYWINTEE